MRERVVIVGAGPAGVAAAVQCRRLGVKPCLFDATGEAGGLVTNAFCVENLPGLAPCEGHVLAARLREDLERFGILVRGETVVRVNRVQDDLVVSTTGGDVVADAVILAVGTRPVRPQVPGMDQSRQRLFFEVRTLLNFLPYPSSVIVLGGGEAALDYALSLAQAGAAVTVVVRGEAPRACERLRDAVAAVPAIRILPRTLAIEYEENEAEVSLSTESGGTRLRLSADCLLIAVGRVSRARDLLDTGLRTAWSGALEPFPGVSLFIAGDARHGGLGQVAMALGDGVAAARLAVEAAS